MRPMSLLSVLSKVLESCITDSIVDLVVINLLLISMSLPKILTHNCNIAKDGFCLFCLVYASLQLELEDCF